MNKFIDGLEEAPLLFAVDVCLGYSNVRINESNCRKLALTSIKELHKTSSLTWGLKIVSEALQSAIEVRTALADM